MERKMEQYFYVLNVESKLYCLCAKYADMRFPW